MKKLLLTVMVLAMLLPFTADANDTVYVSILPDTIVVDSSISSNWECVDSVIAVSTDTGAFIITVSCVADLGPYDWLYLGLGNDSANRVSAATAATTGQTNTNLDTAVFYNTGYRNRPGRIPIVLRHVITGLATAGVTDTIYVNAATGTTGSTIRLEDLVVTVEPVHPL